MRILALLVLLAAAWPTAAAPSFHVRLSPDAAGDAVDGRLIVAVSTSGEREPRFAVGWGMSTAQTAGVTVDGWKPGDTAVVDADAIGHPLPSLADLPPGTYHVQALLNVYETFRRSDGHVVKLPADNGEGQQWNRSPGNLYSEPREVEIGPDSTVELVLDQVIPPIDPPADTEYVRHFEMRSEMLSKFWGRDVILRAIVVVPHGFDEETGRRYPVLYNQGHFPARQRTLLEEIPDLDAMSERQRAFVEPWAEFSKRWMAGELPKVLVVYTQHATPYYDDSYGVNSANTGPYGDALTQEFYPALETAFRGVGEPWARVLFGGSTGGWMSLAQQIFYPRFFGGAWGFCPDPVDFHDFQHTDVYEDDNAFYEAGPFKKMPRGIGRDGRGMLFSTVEDFTRQEEALGDRGRSGGQMDAFHATFGPVDEDGYPRELWDPLTGAIDPEVAAYWRENYDLTAHLRENWSEIGADLAHKLHVTMGTKDTFFLETASYKMRDFLESTRVEGNGPAWSGTFVFGDNEPHCYTATPDGTNLMAYYLPIWVEHMRGHAPEGADTSSLD